MRLSLLPLLFITGALAQRFTTTIGEEIVVATAFTTRGETTTRILDTIDTVEKTTQSFTPSGSVSFNPTDTYTVPKPTRIATLGSPSPLANSGLANVTVTATTSAVPSGTRIGLGAYQTSLQAAQATQSGSASRILPAAPLALAGVVYALM
ncbi:hypothetical protein CcaverHIS002_0703400 [Cutaneotrichosporon cavernicola]|uniref:Uncharacterized protein n=1 Tax=Cutaneotrichosporon cavernicola TaxID=279322 RepID=A0AA48LAB2_9TREE|nr:uncharacterized protein CcaverHIS019_0703470 [Cutaneotrichosporon cavernicola]BEI86994.1 hypothetical protein CcaverHIS002_0703400 [Cutaneotrichosporon cavernicola]BEI94766.1 hypothetical protein CcaverHIS019_0703470 [Cutaneotrichosporon cavernicola]BEJ02541.1 hypothetical protein CcaverHIS631_0703360 [Cutaneotrichosporon cavernicola]BEJ10299.1 hypothetical protein CcaverHIS641_0703340 [Cutaneotrichosporon cavernicola]